MSGHIQPCPKGETPKVKTREPRGAWCVTGYKVISCSCGCLKVSAAYHKGGNAWQTAEARAIEQWNSEVKQQESAQLRKGAAV